MTESSPSANLLRTKRYGVFWFASLLSNIGTWMQSVAEPWLVLSLGGSSFLLGLDAFATNAPFWILALLEASLPIAWTGPASFIFSRASKCFVRC